MSSVCSYIAGVPNRIVGKETSNNYGIISKNEYSIGSSLTADFQEKESFYLQSYFVKSRTKWKKMIKASCENSFAWKKIILGL